MPETMTAGEAAHYLRTSVGTIRRLAHRGDLPASNLGRNWRSRKADLDD
jgi:excisionase family DNA binding protein